MLGTRPDIAFAVIKMSQFSSNPMEEHLQKALYIVRYLSSSPDLCIMYSGTGNHNGLCAYSDTDWAGDVETSRSTTGYAIFLGNGIVSWLSRRQRRVTLSSTEVEYCGMTETAKQLRWIRNIYEELRFKLGPLPLCVDNQGAIFLASNPAQEGRTKHVRMTEHFIREAVEFGEIQLYYVPTDQQFTDIFTKNLGKQKFEDGRKALRLTFEKASLEWCRGNSKVWENPVRENTTHYTVEYTCKVVLRSYLALGCEVTSSVILPAEGWPYLYVWTVCPCIYAYVI
jgi:hypothetical protein